MCVEIVVESGRKINDGKKLQIIFRKYSRVDPELHILESVSDKKDFDILVRNMVLKWRGPFKTKSLTKISKSFLSEIDSMY